MILDKNFDTLGVVSVFHTLLWYRRYYAPGLFELYAPVEFFEMMNRGRYLFRNDRTELGVIREVNFARDDSGARTAYCKGYFAEELLNDRVLDTQVSLTGTPERIAREMVRRLAIEPADSGRKIPRLKLGARTNCGTNITVTSTGARLGDKLYDIEKTQELSHRLVYDYLENTLSFEVWQGKDRTDSQNENSWAIFSDSFYNVKNVVYNRDESGCRNIAYVAGEGEGAERVVEEVDTRNAPDEERRELYIDARDLQSTYMDESGTEHSYTAAEYRALLCQRGLEKLAEYEKVETVNSDVDPDANLVYRTDFDLGDLCTYRYTDIGIETTKRITEIQEAYEGSRQTLRVVFGSDTIVSIEKIMKRSLGI